MADRETGDEDLSATAPLSRGAVAKRLRGIWISGEPSHAENGVKSGTGGGKIESHAENGVNSGMGGMETPPA